MPLVSLKNCEVGTVVKYGAFFHAVISRRAGFWGNRVALVRLLPNGLTFKEQHLELKRSVVVEIIRTPTALALSYLKAILR